MTAPFRIRRPDTGVKAVSLGREENFKFYLDRLLKIIPAEVVSLYLVGSGIVPVDKPIVLAIWAAVCLAGVVLVRAYGTADPEDNKPADWVHVSISSVSFVIWVYTLGGPFNLVEGLHVPYIGSLLVLACTFFAPIVYRGPLD